MTFNVNDSNRYRSKQETVALIFWVRWTESAERFGGSVEPMEGLWRVSFSRVETWIERGEVAIHEYQRREAESNNATRSYVLDLREMECLVRTDTLEADRD